MGSSESLVTVDQQLAAVFLLLRRRGDQRRENSRELNGGILLGNPRLETKEVVWLSLDMEAFVRALLVIYIALGRKMGGWVSMVLVGLWRGASRLWRTVRGKGPHVASLQRKEVLMGQSKVICRVGWSICLCRIWSRSRKALEL
ncbi:hypothetical protein SUGI_0624290 [Cryptomeria japonica]|nr:hypothetical protein SUGI_0624290 [Cryptomeria japonica]